ncbi:dual specificity protein phosphatase PHS1-like, partial [Trifolium medium]|nr:dual specificity protein phosphatase PHS1-like [Trifolium medium]
MTKPQQNQHPLTPTPIINQNQGKEQLDSEGSSPLTVTSRVLYMLGDITSGPALMFTQWVQSVRKRASNHRSSGFPRSSSAMTPF